MFRPKADNIVARWGDGSLHLVSELTGFEYLGAIGVLFGLIAFPVVSMLLLAYFLFAFIV